MAGITGWGRGQYKYVVLSRKPGQRWSLVTVLWGYGGVAETKRDITAQGYQVRVYEMQVIGEFKEASDA